ncbi:uncharacterized protein LOC135104325 [Scylla paramamosain]|uniref:uncharacterized protein LOC135104325 n=1 Tax=Scylla paramamosain TaxID=85552 RepID=UPI0030832B42
MCELDLNQAISPSSKKSQQSEELPRTARSKIRIPDQTETDCEVKPPPQPPRHLPATTPSRVTPVVPLPSRVSPHLTCPTQLPPSTRVTAHTDLLSSLLPTPPTPTATRAFSISHPTNTYFASPTPALPTPVPRVL